MINVTVSPQQGGELELQGPSTSPAVVHNVTHCKAYGCVHVRQDASSPYPGPRLSTACTPTLNRSPARVSSSPAAPLPLRLPDPFPAGSARNPRALPSCFPEGPMPCLPRPTLTDGPRSRCLPAPTLSAARMGPLESKALTTVARTNLADGPLPCCPLLPHLERRTHVPLRQVAGGLAVRGPVHHRQHGHDVVLGKEWGAG